MFQNQSSDEHTSHPAWEGARPGEKVNFFTYNYVR